MGTEAQIAIVAPAPQMLYRVTRGKRVKDQPIATLNEASEIWNAYRASHGVRCSTMPRAEIMVDGKPRAYVSYNGRVWAGRPEDWKSGETPIYDPSADEEGAA